jgi:CRISPR/Cas system-associated exonuclease Cas4 (RecB family)
MALIPKSAHSTSESIVEWWNKQDEGPREHLGASLIGRECERELWYSFRWAKVKKFDGRMKRLFNRGHREEGQMLKELKGIGAEVHAVDPDTKLQHRFRAIDGHFGGSCDGIGRGFPEGPKTWAIVEFKTHNDKSFTELVKKKVQEAKPEHYAQMQVYMGLAELTRALYLAVNKNNDELYSEWVHFDKELFEQLIAKAKRVIDAVEPPLGISQDPAWYKCKMCDYHSLCHERRTAEKNCRTCAHSTPVSDGFWICESQNRVLAYEEQRVGCRAHLLIPPLVQFAEVLDIGNGYVKYRHEDGTIFANVGEDTDRSEENMTNDITVCYTSDELAAAMPALIGDEYIAKLKKEFGAKIVESHNTKTVLPELTDDDIPF